MVLQKIDRALLKIETFDLRKKKVVENLETISSKTEVS